MSDSEPLHVVAEGGLDHLRRLKRVLEAADVRSRIVSPPAAQCSS